MPANYLVLINNRLADARNFPNLGLAIRNEATFFWKKSAQQYQIDLIKTIDPKYFVVEVRKI